jgi:hypothetical protein
MRTRHDGGLSRAKDAITADELNSVADIYKILIDMADKVSQRRQNANSFYLSVNTAITGASAYLSASTTGAANVLVISLAGILVCLSWKRSIDSYKDLNSGTFHVITELEKVLPIPAFTAEWGVLRRGEDKSRYRPSTPLKCGCRIFLLGSMSSSALALCLG